MPVAAAAVFAAAAEGPGTSAIVISPFRAAGDYVVPRCTRVRVMGSDDELVPLYSEDGVPRKAHVRRSK